MQKTISGASKLGAALFLPITKLERPKRIQLSTGLVLHLQEQKVVYLGDLVCCSHVEIARILRLKYSEDEYIKARDELLKMLEYLGYSFGTPLSGWREEGWHQIRRWYYAKNRNPKARIRQRRFSIWWYRVKRSFKQLFSYLARRC